MGHRSGKSHGDSSHTSKSHRSSKPSTHRHTSSTGKKAKPSLELAAQFYFVVCEMNLNEDFPQRYDGNGNIMPPTDPDAYHPESPGVVYYYDRGVVSEAPMYGWARTGGGLNEPGSIGFYGPTFTPIPEYSTHTVFYMGEEREMQYLKSDPVEYGAKVVEPQDFLPLRFNHDSFGAGLSSRVTEDARSAPCVWGTAEWLRSLVPLSQQDPSPRPYVCEGLGGDFGILIGLMALSQHTSYARNCFSNGYWDQGHWLATRTAEDHVPNQLPRGVLVQIALDPSLPEDIYQSKMEDMRNTERWGTTVIAPPGPPRP